MRLLQSIHATAAAAVLAAAAATPSLAQTARPGLAVEPCTVRGVQGPARCGTLEVWENRETRTGRKITIAFTVLPATGVAATKEAVAYFSGGPGQAARDDAANAAQEIASARDTRDLLFMDTRGTGGSNPLPCEISRPGDLQSYLVEFFTVQGVARCAADLAPRADLTQYTSAPAMDDLEELRAALGYDTLDLYGISYGTRSALVFLRRHPEHVRSVLMHGAVPTDIRYPLTVAPDAQSAIDGVFADCGADPGCHAAFPDPAADLRESLRRFAAGPVQATVVSPETGQLATVRLSRERYTEALRYLTYGAADGSLVPAIVHAAARGDFAAAAEQALYFRIGLVSAASRGDYLAVTCPEDVDFVDAPEAARLARGTYFGDWRVAEQKAACAAWPHARLGASFVRQVPSNVPMLIMSGTMDPATAPVHADRTLRAFPNGRRIPIPSAGHDTYGLVGVEPCYGRIVSQFIRTADAKGVDASCMQAVHRPPLPTELPAGHVLAMDSAALARFAGRYTSADQPPQPALELRVIGGRLQEVLGGQNRPLVPVGPLRFRLLNTPQLLITFHESNGAITALRAQYAGAPAETYTRAP